MRIEYDFPLWCVFKPTPGYKAEHTGEEELYVAGFKTREEAEAWIAKQQ